MDECSVADTLIRGGSWLDDSFFLLQFSGSLSCELCLLYYFIIVLASQKFIYWTELILQYKRVRIDTIQVERNINILSQAGLKIDSIQSWTKIIGTTALVWFHLLEFVARISLSFPGEGGGGAVARHLKNKVCHFIICKCASFISRPLSEQLTNTVQYSSVLAQLIWS